MRLPFPKEFLRDDRNPSVGRSFESRRIQEACRKGRVLAMTSGYIENWVGGVREGTVYEALLGSHSIQLLKIQQRNTFTQA